MILLSEDGFFLGTIWHRTTVSNLKIYLSLINNFTPVPIPHRIIIVNRRFRRKKYWFQGPFKFVCLHLKQHATSWVGNWGGQGAYCKPKLFRLFTSYCASKWLTTDLFTQTGFFQFSKLPNTFMVVELISISQDYSRRLKKTWKDWGWD